MLSIKLDLYIFRDENIGLIGDIFDIIYESYIVFEFLAFMVENEFKIKLILG